MEVEEKIKEDMKKLGCKCPKKIALAYSLYIHLVDQKIMYDTEYCYNKDIDTLYVVARPNRNDKLNIYVPVSTSQDVSMNFINVLQENLCTVETGPSINLAFIESDMTTVIYTFTKGLAERPSAEKTSLVRQKEERRTFINSELKKNKSDLLNQALNGGIVDDDDCEVLD
ncbi:uncharacterized protein LOC112051922 [Bicyclus anynana]|uniref:Uncharacterized protein LOC112051922 n=1 Tax=Bicyclus anynana TaxID=110368 RepID=A0A6J1NHV9_BICAN|nr:uncharacterized protein LOC112051922 [Bicyclus anynana]